MIRRRLQLSFGFLLGLLLVGCGGEEPWGTKDISGLMPELALQATGQGGRNVTAADYRGRVVLLFFGFTHCPDVCPTTLARLAQVRSQLEQPEDLQVLFVTVDPERDSREVLDRYAAAFGEQVEGLRLDVPELKRLTKRYRVTYGYGDPDASGAYPVSHSSAVFAFDREGRARLLIRDSDPTPAVVSDLQRLLQAD